MYLRTVDTFKFDNLHLGVWKTKRRKKVKYADIISAFDIETSNLPELQQSIMYIWQFQLGEKWTITGRTWDEFKTFIQRLEDRIPDGCYLACYVHNLSFEFQFLKSIIPVDDVLAMDDRKILRFRSGKLEFRCSYLHSNMSLEKFLDTMEVKSRKVKGFDYEKIRYPWTELTPDELLYCVNDVRGLVQAIRNEMEKDGDDIYSIPMTSTGYSRREAKKALGGYRIYIKDMLPDLETFHALRQAFRGGNTHANRYYSNMLLEASRDGPITSYDISSSYPSVMLTERFPGKFRRTDPKYFRSAYRHDRACLLHMVMRDVRLRRPEWGCPYLAKGKVTDIARGEYDNGRILRAEYIELYITEIDYDIIAEEYDFNYEILELWTARKSRLPEKLQALILKTYEEKTQLKGLDDYLYTKKKNLFNAYYGMMVQNPCKVNYEFVVGIMQEKPESLESLIDYYQRTGWLPYQWGVWVTAYARKKLEEGLRLIPAQDFVYTDTDSIKFLGDHNADFAKLNKKYLHESLSALDPKGKRHYIGIFEKEEEYRAFKSLGAKKYAYTDQNGKLHLTVAGVAKKAGAAELGDIHNFNEGFIFRKAGGLAAYYNDQMKPVDVTYKGHKLQISSNVCLLPSEYTLGLTPDYSRLIYFLMNTDIRSSLHYIR